MAQLLSSPLMVEREACMYRTVLPAFVDFQREKGLTPENGFFAFPRCYGIVADAENDNYAIVMEDLKEKGYDMFNKFNSIDLGHVRFIMEELVRYHAVSFAMRDQRLEVFTPFLKLKDVFMEMIRRTRGFDGIGPVAIIVCVSSVKVTAVAPLCHFSYV